MLGLFKRKKKSDKSLSDRDKGKHLKTTLDEELDKEKKRKKKKEKEGPNWMSVLILFVCVGAGLFFFVYGRISQLGWAGLVPSIPETPDLFQPGETRQNRSTPLPNSDGVIIFEK